MEEKLLDVAVFAQKIQKSTSTVYNMIRDGAVDFVPSGARKGYKIPEYEAERIMTVQRRGDA